MSMYELPLMYNDNTVDRKNIDKWYKILFPQHAFNFEKHDS